MIPSISNNAVSDRLGASGSAARHPSEGALPWCWAEEREMNGDLSFSVKTLTQTNVFLKSAVLTAVKT